MDTLIVLLVTAVVFSVSGFLAGRKRQAWIENVGESAVRKYLIRAFPGSEYHLMNNVTIPFEDGTTQIDHILVSVYGIFVIETKHYTGWIFGDENSKTWTQVIYYFKSHFKNPIHQNYKHIIALRKILDFVPKDYIHSIVVFTGEAEFKTKYPEGVVDIYGLYDYIEKCKEIVLTKNRMQFCVGRIETIRKIISKRTDIEHQEYLMRKHLNRINKYDN